jgi:hypothetical protein
LALQAVAEGEELLQVVVLGKQKAEDPHGILCCQHLPTETIKQLCMDIASQLVFQTGNTLDASGNELLYCAQNRASQ